ncbi:LuxR family transcriptional regulator [Blastochloris viridis]|uniref:Transcriptional activator protein luxR n=1 Tax=Blastochloris viridis TaxID=1079 RepID=A0A0H5BIC0_BLAVI|nr:LuxR family transcriptional regulator [Blastochloris viridis]ALK09249.1 Transcriptional activator protein LuxR [Blastochloris viridis]BAS00880.1 transcriptional regulator [Blastochloris viridis]CUU41912.1 Transcriptional activator protein luxR [Blastochloris viridis]
MASLVDHAKIAFSAVERLEKAVHTNDLIKTFRLCLDPFGYNVVLITGLPDPPADPQPFFLVNSWPNGWHDRYLERDYYRDDPVAAFGRVRIDPFTWHDAPIDDERQPRGRLIMAEAADIGMRDGLVIPIVTSRSLHSCVSVAGEAPERDPDVQRAIHLVGMFAHARAVQLASEQAPVRRRLLSDREREVLLWVAAGKTAWEISRILGIAERTVIYHVTTAARRLQAVSRTHAVARAIALGEISIP